MIWVLAVVAAVASAAAHQRLVVPRLPAPAVVDDDPPPDYRTLGSVRDVLGAAAFALAAALLALPRLPDAHLPMWVGFLGAGAALAWVDLRTTWLPRRLHHICLGQVALGLAWLALTDWRSAVAAVVGGLTALGLFHLVWRLGNGLGYGDVRLVLLVGAVAGAGGLDRWLLSLLAGTLLGALWAILHVVRARRSGSPAHFPYGPALWFGPALAMLVTGW